MKKPLVSLCMPTNGVSEWVFPVLNSIYSQECNTDLFEVIVTDNGNNKRFKQQMRMFVRNHTNCAYYENRTYLFLNEIESYKKAEGAFIKFVNHRTLLLPNSLQKIIDFVEKYINEKPIIYFSNGALKFKEERIELKDFDSFVAKLSFWSSWSTGMGFWKEDFEKMPKDIEYYNELFPHTTILFSEKCRSLYYIDNSVIFEELPQGAKPKGTYDLFFAFAVEYPAIILDLLRKKNISKSTFKKIIDENLEFVIDQYIMYCIQKKYCSYDVSKLSESLDVFYTKRQFFTRTIKRIISRMIRKLIKKI